MEPETQAPELLPRRIGRYEVLGLLGRGGMGAVYLAWDPSLDRRVAIKVVLDSPRDDTGLRARLLAEARAVAALNHPNIVTVHEVGTTGVEDPSLRSGLPYLVMEYVEGRSLLQLLRERRLTPEETCDLARQILEGLRAAHEKGIVHRDVKPSNLVLTADGRVKLLDFGLCKPAALRAPRPETGEGLVVGTVDYVSPEQATGGHVDERTDLFSFGIVLYEMLAGSHPFGGATAAEKIASIVTQPARKLPGEVQVPDPLVRLVWKSLQKDPRNRFGSASEALAELDRVRTGLTTATTRREEPDVTRALGRVDRPRLARRLAAVLGALAAVAALLLAGSRLLPRKKAPLATPLSITPSQVTTSAGLDVFPSFSPDGTAVAYASDHDGSFEIYVRQVAAGGSELKVTSDGGQNLEPTFSPDGGLIAYSSIRKGGIWVLPALGGSPRRLTDFGSRPAFSPDGRTIAFQSDPLVDLNSGAFPALPPSTIWLVPVAGGAARPLTRAGEPAGGHGSPTFSPDGRRIAFVTYVRPNSEVWSVGVSGADLVPLSRTQPYYFDPAFEAGGHGLLFCAAALNAPSGAGLGLFRLPVDSRSGQAQGPPVEVMRMGLAAVRHVAVSRDGRRLAFAGLVTSSNLFSLELGRSGARPVPLTSGSARNSRPVFSPDGRHLAYAAWRTGTNNDIWLMDADGKNAVPLTSDPATDDFPSFFPDGKRIAFLSTRRGAIAVFELAVAGVGERLLRDLGPSVESARLSPDGRYLAYNSKQGGATVNVWVAGLPSDAPRQVTFDRELMGFPCWSPDSSVLAVEMKRGDDYHVAVVPREGGTPEQLTFDHGTAWPWSFSPDGERVAFASLRDGIWNVAAVSVRTKKQEVLTSFDKRNVYVRYPAFSPDGTRVVFELAETTGNIWVAQLPGEPGSAASRPADDGSR